MKHDHYTTAYVQELKKSHQRFESQAKEEFEVLTKDRDYQRHCVRRLEDEVTKLSNYAEQLEKLVANQRQSVAIMQKLLDEGKP